LSQTRLPARAAGLAATLGLAAALLTAAPAVAAPDWGTLSSLDDAKLQACKVSVDDGDAWRVRLRVKNGNDYRVRSVVTVHRGGNATDRVWRSGWVAGGGTESGQVRTGTGAVWDLVYSLSADELGGGGTTSVSALGRC
jgi:hypothetical protein